MNFIIFIRVSHLGQGLLKFVDQTCYIEYQDQVSLLTSFDLRYILNKQLKINNLSK